MAMAIAFGQLSYSKRKQVGALIIKNGNIIACGYNGTPTGFDNTCEEEDVTKKEVLHAESNCIAKIARSNNSSVDSVLYTTMSPCFDCSKLIIQSGIKQVYYLEEYRDTSGIDLLRQANIQVDQLLL
jgi:dCMP deaminase